MMANPVLNLCSALSGEIRARIAHALTRADLCVCELSDVLDLRQSTLSNHLRKMRLAGVVDVRKDGLWVYYRLAPAFKDAICGLCERFGKDLAHDPLLRRDSERLEKRLKMRINGRCCRTYGQLKEESKLCS